MGQVLRQFKPKHLRRRQRGLCARRHRHRQLQLLGSLQGGSARLLNSLRHQLHSQVLWDPQHLLLLQLSFVCGRSGRLHNTSTVCVNHTLRLEVDLCEVRAFGKKTYDQLQQERQANALQLEHVLRHSKQNNLVVFGVPESLAYSLPAELVRHMQGVLFQTAPASGLTTVRSAYWLGRWQQDQLKPRAVLVELTSVAAKHTTFQASSQLRADRIRIDKISLHSRCNNTRACPQSSSV